MEIELKKISLELGQKLRKAHLLITCAESCTGGWLAKAITDIAGSSAYFERGFITYSDQAKQDLLNVSLDALQHHGAVSEIVANAMAKGALESASADIAIAVTGIAGPDGGTIAKPVGTVCFSIVSRLGTQKNYTCHFQGDREEVRLKSVIFALKTVNNEFL